MGYTPRTVIRHTAIYLILAILPLPLVGLDSFLFWLKEHSLFLVLWNLSMAATGVASHFLVVRGIPGRLLKQIYGSTSRSIPLRIASCSRCFAYWTSGSIAFLMAIVYFPGWIAGFYFFAAGASLGAAVSVGTYFLSRNGKESDSDLTK